MSLLDHIRTCIASNQTCYIPPGTHEVDANELALDFSGSDGVFEMVGSGTRSIIKLRDGAIKQGETSKRLLDLRPTGPMRLIRLADLHIDGNARGQLGLHEQNHAVRLGAYSTVDRVEYHNVTVEDPSGDGFCNQSLAGNIREWLISDCREINKTSPFRSSIQCSVLPESLIVSNFTGNSIETESGATDDRAGTIQLVNCKMSKLDLASKSIGKLTALISNCVTTRLCVLGGINARFSNCDLQFNSKPNLSFNPHLSFFNCDLRLSSTDGVIHPLNVRHLEIAASESLFELDGCRFHAVGSKGYQLTASAVRDSNHLKSIRNCTFSNAGEGSVEAFRNGHWMLSENNYGGDTGVVVRAAGDRYFVDVDIAGGDFRRCRVHISHTHSPNAMIRRR